MAATQTQAQSGDKGLNGLFLHTLKDMYSAEKQILKSLDKMSENAKTQELKEAFKKHRGQTEAQITRLEKVFELCHERPQSVTCEAMTGILEEGTDIMSAFKDSEALDAGILAAAQTVEHYEISRYGTLRSWAEQLGMNDAVQLLEQTLDEEKETDKILTRIAEQQINKNAA